MTRRAHVDAAALDAVAAGGPLPDATLHRFTRVLRLADGAPIELFDGRGRACRGTLAGSALAGAVVVEEADPLPPLVVAQAVTKTDKLELVVQKCTELGASAFWLVDCARGQVHLDGDRADKRRARLARVADDAARQCLRKTSPAMEGPLSFAALCDRARSFAGVAVAGVVGAELPLSQALARSEETAAKLEAGGLLVLVGPEGGLDPSEVERARSAGFLPVRLGAHVLRTETAGVVALAAAQTALGLL